MTHNHYYLSEKPINIFKRNCRYCKKQLIFDSRVRSKGGSLVPLNPEDRSIHQNCLKLKCLKNSSETGSLRTNVAEGTTTIHQLNHQKEEADC